MLRALTRACVRYAERYIPDPYLYAVILTFITAGAALVFTESAPAQIATAWYDGIWNILAFAMQMALILSTGVALAAAPPVKRLLERIASIPSRQGGAAVTVFLAGAFGSWLNWGFGLVVGALVAREVAKKIRDVDFGLIVAAAYMGNMVWASGLSSSIALASATPGSTLNVIERETGRIASLGETIFTAYNLVPTILVCCLIPLMLMAIGPNEQEMKRADPALLARDDEVPTEEPRERSFATVLENAWILTLLLVAMGLIYEWNVIATRGFMLDINGMIFIALMLGLILHWRPIRYVRRRAHGRPDPAPVPALWRHHGHDDRHRPCRRDLGSVRRVLDPGHAAVLELRLVEHHQPVRALRRRPLGGAGALHDSRRDRSSGQPRDDRDGGRHGRADREHDPALLGAADPRHRAPRHQGHHGLLRDGAVRRPRRLRLGAPHLCLGPAMPRHYSLLRFTFLPRERGTCSRSERRGASPVGSIWATALLSQRTATG